MLFDADGDGDNDLYVVSGGSGLPPGNPFYADRLYINDGKGNSPLRKTPCLIYVSAVPRLQQQILTGTETLTFLSAAGWTWSIIRFPRGAIFFVMTAKDQLSRFTDITSSVAKDLEKPGLVASAIWTDFNKDGWSDLILAGEWMPLTFFKNDKGKLINVTSQTGLEKYTGWWNSITACDIDKDGDIDYVAGNLGLNTQYKVSQEEPMRIIAKDFDRNGSLDPDMHLLGSGKKLSDISQKPAAVTDPVAEKQIQNL